MPTSSHIAAHILFAAKESFGDIDNQFVLDLGIGTGMLSIAASLLGASHIVGVDIDPTALEIAKQNIDAQEISNIDLIQANVAQHDETMFNVPQSFDTVVMNPVIPIFLFFKSLC